MSTPITTYGLDAVPGRASKRTSVIGRALERFLAAREAQGRRRAYEYISSLSDARLSALGYSEEEIKLMREERRLPPR